MNPFDKVYVLDSNIILDNAYNLELLSEQGKNLIVLPETVLDELDSKKSLINTEIGFQARQFARLLQDAVIDNQIKHTSFSIIETSISSVKIHIISKDKYDVNDVAKEVKNDRKILEVTKDYLELYPDLIFLSLDVMARTRALSLGIQTESLTLGNKDADSDKDFHAEICIDDFIGVPEEIPEQEEHISSIQITNEQGKPFIYFRNCTEWIPIPEKNPHRLAAPPINLRQKVMSSLILDKNDVVVISGPAGTGKTLVALSSAMKLCDTNKDLYKKIYYIRRTVISGTKEDELGFLPGTLEEKMQGYNQPMESALKTLAKLKKKNQTPEEIEERIFDMKEKYQIEYLYAGHLRGDNLDDGSILIMDEVQNWDITSSRTIVSRVGKDSIILAMGSNNQIDSAYLTKNTNALTYLMDKCGQENDSDVRMKGVKLTNVMRSKLAEWADKELY